MEELEQYQRLFQQLVKEEEQLHTENQRRIRSGIRCLVLIPMLFLALLFLTEGEKVIFLVMWVVSLFLIAGYLIYVEYIDFQAQERLHRYTDQEHLQEEWLIGADMEAFEETVAKLLRQIDERKAHSRQKRMELVGQQKDKLLGREMRHDEYH